MNNSDFKQTAEKYKKEMMKLYGGNMSSNMSTPPPQNFPQMPPQTPSPPQNNSPQTPPQTPSPPQNNSPQTPPQTPSPPQNNSPQTPPQTPPPPQNSPQTPPQTPPPPQNSPQTPPQTPPPPQNFPQMPPQTPPPSQVLPQAPPKPSPPPDFNIEDRFPPPVLPDFITGGTNQNNSYGYLKVSVKTGRGGLPLADSLVTVSEIRDGKENVIKLMSTDSSGNTEILRLPAPLQSIGNTPSDYDKFAKYNVSAYSKGYFRETSIDVPIFAGITSIQNFSLIPEPFNYNSGERTIVDRNPEPVI